MNLLNHYQRRQAMVLPSYSFIFIFLPAVVILYHIMNMRQWYNCGKTVLLLASILFYVMLTPGVKGLAALLLSVVFCYTLAVFGLKGTLSHSVRRVMLAVGIIANITALIYCRYLSYIRSLIEQAGGTPFVFEAIVVPVGISYFTFSQIAFLVDKYRDPDIGCSFLDYLLFVSFFPKISVGPIALSSELIPQFNDRSRKSPDWNNLSVGFYRFVLGLSKKLILADNLGKYVDIGYSNISTLGSFDILLVTLSYTLQIYFDFSGYCDIASGICLMLNLDLCENFDGPYHSLSVSEFWKRWHISLTRFFRNYLYIPLGGNRKGKIRTYINNLFIFLISGLWHGASTHFVLWGGIHGVGIIISKLISPVTSRIPKAIRWFMTFSFVNLAWVFFRADDTAVATDVLKRLFTAGALPLNNELIAACVPTEFHLLQWIIFKTHPAWTYYGGCAVWLILVGVSLCFSAFAKTCRQRCDRFVASKRYIVTTVILFTWSVLSLSQVAEFIYVNF